MSSPRSSRRPWLLYGLVALVFSGGVWYFGFRDAPAKPSGGMSFHSRGKGSSTPTPVKAVPAQRKDMTVHLRAIGTVTPLNTVTVRGRVEGQLIRVAFKEGQEVAAGQVLVEIDPLPYKLRLSQMEAQHRQNQAQFNTAKADLDRFKKLHAQSLVTDQQLEAQQSLVAERKGAVEEEKALVEDARRQLAYTKVEAPIAGRLGLRQIDVGNLVRPSDATGLVVITQTRPIAVMLTVPENDLQKVVDPMRAGETVPVEAWDRNDQNLLATGVLKTVDNQIDLATGTLRLKAEFANANEELFPNQFVNVRLRVRTLKDALVVPTSAVQYGSRGTYVYLMTAENKATVRDVVLGPSDGPVQSIAKGLEAGERVIVEGVDRLREGRAVFSVDDQPAPPAKSAGGETGKTGEKSKKGK